MAFPFRFLDPLVFLQAFPVMVTIENERQRMLQAIQDDYIHHLRSSAAWLVRRQRMGRSGDDKRDGWTTTRGSELLVREKVDKEEIRAGLERGSVTHSRAQIALMVFLRIPPFDHGKGLSNR